MTTPRNFTIEEILALVNAGEIDIEEALRELASSGVDEAEARTLLQGTGRVVFPDSGAAQTTAGAPGLPNAPAQAAGAQEFGAATPLQNVVDEVRQGIPIETDPLRTIDPRTAFRGFATSQFSPGLSGAARRSVLNQFSPTQLSFQLDAPETSFAATDQSEGFARFLQQGGRALSPSNLAGGISELAGQFSRGEGGLAKSEFFSDNERIFEQVLRSALPRVNPSFRGAFETAARNRFAQQQLEDPSQNFFQTLGLRQGGRLLGGQGRR